MLLFDDSENIKKPFSANIYLLKSTIETLEKEVKYVQSYQ